MHYSPKVRELPRNLKRKRALSYILSVVMMTLVTTSLATSVLLWGLTQVAESRTTLSSAVKARMERMQEGFVVEDVKMINTTSLRIYVRNNGARQLVIDQAYMNHTAANTITAQGGGARLSLAVREVGFVDAKFSSASFALGSTVLIRVTTTRGVADVDSWKL